MNVSSGRGMQLRIRHTSGYTYENPAVASYNEARMTPLTTPEQMVLRPRVDVTPTAWSQEYRDYWGSTVTSFEVHEPHDELVVVATSTVETSGFEHPVVPGGSWADLEPVADELCEFLVDAHWTRPSDTLVREVRALRDVSDTPGDYARATLRLVHDRIRYVPGATEVTTPAADAWEAQVGVCQDIAHVSLGALRWAGVPARYVSGYLHPDPDPQVGETVPAESHAWVEFWDGDWVGFDPTNDVAPGERHVAVARGRDYADNPPLRGIYSTRGASELFVAVEITRTR
ncbi:transglutaminase N-terminal domain-containing protein [Aeromicrobium sp. CF4.19]|uniref:transglutaminase family protein n=1 Tax=Aeromicrobium sp. CF4.19 TaxID=3373082 RepID=UPI003EE5F240